MTDINLTPLPLQPESTPWPTEQWPREDSPIVSRPAFEQLTNGIFDLKGPQGFTYALLVVHRGRIVYERYEHGHNAFYLQYSWSMAKSITHALAGILVREGLLDIHARAAVPEWQKEGDPRREITLDHLLKMRSGLAFNEEYVDGSGTDVIPMLLGDGRHDMGAFAASKPLAHAPDTFFSYSSGTTNIICRVLRDVVANSGRWRDFYDFMRTELFEPIGMRTPTPRFDGAGTFVGSSFCLAIPQDFARFGLLYLRDGLWDGQRILPEGWADHARTHTFQDAEYGYGAQWWLPPENAPGVPADAFWASGYDGQRIACVPSKDLMVIRNGRTPEDHAPYVWDQLWGLTQLFD